MATVSIVTLGISIFWEDFLPAKTRCLAPRQAIQPLLRPKPPSPPVIK